MLIGNRGTRRAPRANPIGVGHTRPALNEILLGSLLALSLLLPIAIPAQETEAPEAQTQTAEEQEEGPQKDADTQVEKEVEDTEETEDPSLVEDIIPSEMISEDLAVDFPIDI